ncbi:hypothetical protein GWI33_008040 [Rhynchophorus ferrugineus]|uniref:Uncharacterized protein n=1 Tax=Rhynchophorus ferrugineus TaxID=354439 RepID=A0A834ICI6_RHYFE|nr:hypothetical protein GWI33_008040 [Rhynchophorus ferrugineus]
MTAEFDSNGKKYRVPILETSYRAGYEKGRAERSPTVKMRHDAYKNCILKIIRATEKKKPAQLGRRTPLAKEE